MHICLSEYAIQYDAVRLIVVTNDPEVVYTVRCPLVQPGNLQGVVPLAHTVPVGMCGF